MMKTIFLVSLHKSSVPIIDLWIHLNMMARSLDIELFIVKEKLVTKNYSKITSRMIQRTAPTFSDEGLWIQNLLY
jgi:hypothetical protein